MLLQQSEMLRPKWVKRVYTFNDAANANLISMGVVPIEPNHFSKLQDVNT